MSSTRCFLVPLLLTAAACAAGPAARPGPVVATTPEPAHAPELAAGLQAMAAGEYESARLSFEAAVRSNPRDDVALWDLG
ncbi:MAG: hypothetical protein ACRELB_24190, partial [Polyangiaceae bacterium]